MTILTKKWWKKIPPMKISEVKRDLIIILLSLIGLGICLLVGWKG
jgi:hypothetical protein